VCIQSLLGTRGFGSTAALVLTAEFTRLLHDFEAQVDRTEGKLAAATRRMNFFLQKAEGENLSLLLPLPLYTDMAAFALFLDSESRWSIYILIAVLSILLLLVLIL